MRLVEELIPEIIGFQTCSINPSGSVGGGVASRTGSSNGNSTVSGKLSKKLVEVAF